MENKEPIVYISDTLVGKALEFLEDRNIELKGFELEDVDKWAIMKANHTRLKELIKLKLKHDEGIEYYDFMGNNCEYCEGWDGYSKRCECGDRRVTWLGYISFLDDDSCINKLYAESY